MEDLDVPKLAEYLHLTPEQVKKMAVRGRLPGLPRAFPDGRP